MRIVSTSEIVNVVEKMCIDGNYFLGEKMLDALQKARDNEESPLGKTVLETIIENDILAANEQVPMCQDTGVAVFFLEIGREVYVDGDVYEAINEGVRRGYMNGFLRKSIVKHPLDRVNTNDNTPAVIHTKIVPGDQILIKFAAKGAGSENMSRQTMLKPADGYEGVKKFVIDVVRNAKGNPCPPIIVGVGVGGNFESSAIMAKESLFREVDDQSSDPIAKKLEEELYSDLNKLGIGPMGFGGSTTVLAVKVNVGACHIAALPVSVNIQCHASRKVKAVI